MSIDWASTGTMIQGWAGFAQAGAIAFAAWKAADTFKLWRSQKIEERRIDVAERILTLADRIKRAFSDFRSPFYGHELATAEAKLRSEMPEFASLGDSQRRKMATGRAIAERINCYSPEWEQIFELLPLTKALFGEETAKHLEGFWQQRNVVWVAAESHADDDGSDANFTKTMITANLYEREGEPEDRVGTKVTELVSSLEAKLLPIIRLNYKSTDD